MPIKKSELYSSLWASCDELRGGMDASQYKDYVLVLLFVKYVSDKYAGQPYSPIVVPEGGGFEDIGEEKTVWTPFRLPGSKLSSGLLVGYWIKDFSCDPNKRGQLR